MTFTYDNTTPIGQVRLLCTDTDSTRQIFGDDEIQVFLNLMNNEALLAAAMALDTIASNELLREKVVTIMGLEVDGATLSKTLAARAANLREVFQQFSADGFAFATAEFADGIFQDSEHVWKTFLREFAVLGGGTY